MCWDDELASHGQKKIMDLFMEENADQELFANEVKEQAGFGKGGEKNFEWTLTSLELVTSADSEGPRNSLQKLVGRVKQCYPEASEREILRLIGYSEDRPSVKKAENIEWKLRYLGFPRAEQDEGQPE